jgi:hypothetical protein
MSDTFYIRKHLKQWEKLSSLLLLNSALEYDFSKDQEDQEVLDLNGTRYLLVYVNDTHLMAKTYIP